MIILQAKAKQGKSRELIKRFITDGKSATLITDELGLDEIYNLISLLKQEGHDVNNNNENAKFIKTTQYANCNADYYSIIQDGRCTDNLYLDIHVSKDIFKSIKQYCKEIESEYGGVITLVEQLPANSDIKGVNVVVETE